MDAIAIVMFVIVALVLGCALGWFLGSRGVAPLRSELEGLRQRCGSAERECAAAGERASRAADLQKLLDAVVAERDTAAREAASLRPVAERAAELDRQLTGLRAEKDQLAAAKAGFERGEVERRQAYEAQLNQVKELEAKLETRFGDLAGKALETAHDAFLKRAGERMTVEGRENEAKLRALLQPVETTLKRYESDLRQLEQDRKGAYEGLFTQINMLREGQDRVASEALRLRTALRSSTRDVGRWGEEQCRNVLEQAGLQEGIDFEEQVANDVVDDRSKPDFVVKLPGDRRIVIDVKCSLDAFIGATETDQDTIREKLLIDHAKAIRVHASGLVKRSYQDKFKGAADFTVMFVPGENFLHAAIQRDPKLLYDAQRGKVIVVGPTNLVSLLLNVAALRDQAKLNERAEQIAALGRKLYENLATLGKNAQGMSNAMRSLVSNWNKLATTMDGRWLGTARKFDELGVGKNSPEVSELSLIDIDVGEPLKLTSKSDINDPVEETLHFVRAVHPNYEPKRIGSAEEEGNAAA